MIFEEFAKPFLLLQSHFEQRPRDADDEKLYRLSWFKVMQPFSAEVWGVAVDRWIGTQKWMPKPVEMKEVCYEEATRLVLERNERERLAPRPGALPADPQKVAELKERMRRLKAAMQLQPPEPSDAPPLLPGGDDGH